MAKCGDAMKQKSTPKVLRPAMRVPKSKTHVREKKS